MYYVNLLIIKVVYFQSVDPDIDLKQALYFGLKTFLEK